MNITAGAILEGLVDLVFPRRCVQCRAAGSWLCEPCAGGLSPLPLQRCPRCAAPLRAGETCRECAGRELAFEGAAAAFAYEGPARALVTACKFRALRSLTGELAERAGPAFTAACGGTGPAPDTLVTWVPGHREHSLERGFNQAELLARRLARQAGLPAAPTLRRLRHGARQSGLDRRARAANVAGAFALRQDTKRVLSRFKRVVLVDDVYTTGETLNQCSGVLAQAGVRPLVFTFARTVRRPRSSSPSSSRTISYPKEPSR